MEVRPIVVVRPTLERHVRPGFRDRYIRRHRTTAAVYRVVIALLGAAVVAVGVALLALPGPGWLIIFAGLAILASEFAWAERLLAHARAQVEAWTRWLGRQPLPVRLGVALLCLLVVLAAVLAYAAVVGLPDWLPDVLGDPVDAIVG